jgi:hypothetical protein
VLQAFEANVDGNRRHWVARIQEIAGKATEFKLLSRWRVISADELTMTEDNVVRRDLDPSRLSIDPHETLTLGLTLSR